MSWIETFTGRRMYPADPKPDQITIVDIAHALSNKCRYTGHTSSFYSVAQHSVLVSNIVNPEYAWDALLHDAAEAYLPDVAKPIRHLFPKLMELEDNMHKVICKKYDVIYPYVPEVKFVDKYITLDEARSFMVSKGSEGFPSEDGEDGFFGDKLIASMTPEQAKQKFLDRFNELNQPKVLVAQ